MNKEVEEIIGWNLSKIRVLANMSQEELSAKLQLEGVDITRSALAKIEIGQRHLYPDEIIAFKKILNCKYDEIFDLSKKNK